MAQLTWSFRTAWIFQSRSNASISLACLLSSNQIIPPLGNSSAHEQPQDEWGGWFFSPDQSVYVDSNDPYGTACATTDSTGAHTWFLPFDTQMLGTVTRFLSAPPEGKHRTFEYGPVGGQRLEFFPDGRTKYYNPGGRITKLSDRDGNSLTYEPLNRTNREITRITQSNSGRGVAMTWTGTSPHRRVQYVYETDSSANPVGPVLLFLYESRQGPPQSYLLTKAIWYDNNTTKLAKSETYEYASVATNPRMTKVSRSETGSDSDLKQYRAWTFDPIAVRGEIENGSAPVHILVNLWYSLYHARVDRRVNSSGSQYFTIDQQSSWGQDVTKNYYVVNGQNYTRLQRWVDDTGTRLMTKQATTEGTFTYDYRLDGYNPYPSDYDGYKYSNALTRETQGRLNGRLWRLRRRIIRVCFDEQSRSDKAY